MVSRLLMRGRAEENHLAVNLVTFGTRRTLPVPLIAVSQAKANKP